MFVYKGKTALITGASSGIGAVFARQLAERGSNLVLVARSQDKLQALADELTGKHGIQAHVITADLSRADAPQQVFAATQERSLTIDLLVNNAGFGTYGLFDQTSQERQHDEIMLNVTALVDLTHLFLLPMLGRSDGAVINVASTAGFQPLPYMAVYAATKAFVISFSEALWSECRQRGVRVMALCPGATETSFFDAVGSREPAVGAMQAPEVVVATALRGLERGRSTVVPGWQNSLTAMIPRFFPRPWVVRIARRVMQPEKSGSSTPATSQQ